MTNVIKFPRPRITVVKKYSRCVSCGNPAIATNCRSVGLQGGSLNQRQKVLICQDCYDETPSWVWADR